MEEKIQKSPQAIEMLRKIKRENRKKFLKKHKIILVVLSILLISVLLFYLIRNIFFYTVEEVKVDNMSKTIKVGDNIKIVKNFDDIKYGNIYKFKKDGETYIARCIGVEGDVVRVENDDVYINGVLFSERYVSSKIDSKINLKVKVPKGKYFFLGDNRKHSFDSRYWENRFVDKDDIEGEVTEIVYTFSKNKDITYH